MMIDRLTAVCIAAGLALPAFAQDIPGNSDLPNSNPPAEAPTGNSGPDDLFGNLAELKAVKEQIDSAIAETNAEFKSLLEQDNLSFGDMRRLAALRQELGEDVAPELVAQIAEIKAAVDAQNTVGAGERLRIARPELTDEQQATIQEHKDALDGKRDELDAILVAADDSGRYEELLTNEDKTADEKQELRELRRALIDGSPDALAKVQEIREFNSDFRQAFRSKFERSIVSRPQVRPTGETRAMLESKVNDILAQSNTEFAELLAKDDKGDEDLARLAELRTELIQNADGEVADQLARTEGRMLRAHQLRGTRRRRGLHRHGNQFFSNNGELRGVAVYGPGVGTRSGSKSHTGSNGASVFDGNIFNGAGGDSDTTNSSDKN